jgi:hypothetical protein
MFRGFLLVMAVSFLLMGLTTYRRGEPDYPNYWGGPIPWWLPVVMVPFLVWAALKWTALDRKGPKESPRARRNRRKAERKREAVDDFDKPWSGG